MAANYKNFEAPQGWTDLYAAGTANGAYVALANQKVTVQHLTIGSSKIYAGGAAAPADSEQGFTLAAGQSWTGTTDHLWVRGPSRLAIGRED